MAPAEEMFENLKQQRRLTIGYMDVSSSTKLDVTFIVENKTISSNINILSRVSPVFDRMFHGDFVREEPIPIEESTFKAFELFLKFIHEGTRSIAIYMAPKEGIGTLMLANRYLITDLEDFLRLKLLRTLNFDSVLSILPLCQLHINLYSIQSKCWSVIEHDTKKVLDSKSFLNINWDMLCSILENSRLRVNEKTLFYAAKKWADNQLKLYKKGTTTSKEVLGVALYKIRFPIMTKLEFRLVKSTNFLGLADITDLENNFRNNTTFPNKPRRYSCACRKNNFDCALCHRNERSIKGYVARSNVQKQILTPCMLRCQCGRLHSMTRVSNQMVTFRRDRVPQAKVEQPKPTKSLDINSNINPAVHVIPESCECFKYKSCPSFPNGETAKILESLGII